MTSPWSSTSLILSRRFAGHACSSARCRAGFPFLAPRAPPPPLTPLGAPAVVLAVSSLGRFPCVLRPAPGPPADATGVPALPGVARPTLWPGADARNPDGGEAPFGAMAGCAMRCGGTLWPGACMRCWCGDTAAPYTPWGVPLHRSC